MLSIIHKMKYSTFIILIFIIFLFFILHSLPLLQMDFATTRVLQDPDTWYTYRQIEVMSSNLFQYNWFDFMTVYFYGKDIDWGFLYSIFCVTIMTILGGNG